MLRKLVLLFCFCFGVHMAGSVMAQEIYEEAKGLYSTSELLMSLKLDKGRKIQIRSVESLKGYLNIMTTTESKVVVSYFKRARTSSRSRAIDYIDLTSVTLGDISEGVRLELRAPNPPPWSLNEAALLEIEIAVPESCFVEIEAPAFDIDARGPFSGFVVSSSLGRIEVSDVQGEVEIETANRRVSLENATGDISVQTSNATLVAFDINSEDGQAKFENEGGDIRIDGIVGTLNLRCSYGRVEVDNFALMGGRSFIRGLSEPVVVNLSRISDGQLIVNNRYEDIELTVPRDVSTSFSLSVEEDSKIEVLNIPFTADLVLDNRLNLTSGDGSSLVRGAIRGSGNIYVRGADED